MTNTRQTQSHLMQLFSRQGIHPRHYLGQNFLIDLNLLDYIMTQSDLDEDDVVLEVGAGTGSLTAMMAQHAGAVVSVEIDPTMHELARAATARYENVTLLNCDALKNKNTFSPLVMEQVERELGAAKYRQLKLVANLPYNVATPVISNLVVTDLPWQRMVVTIQWELAERMASGPGSGDYSALSAWLQAQCDVKILKRLPPTVFWPKPKVNSAIVRVTSNDELKKAILDRKFFHDFLKRLFTQRRKFLRGVLAGMYSQQLHKLEIDAILGEFAFTEKTRAEELESQTLLALSNAVYRAIEAKTEV
jgi:16S rRNA (adenine1518-N6/adenine1519-N6)-dimethyltransferase